MRVRHPDVALQIVDATAQSLQERLVAGEIDVAIYALPTLATDERLNYLPLYREPFVVALRPSHRLARQERIRVKDLAGEPQLRWSLGEHEPVMDEIFSHQGIENPVAYQSEREKWVLAMAAAGLGYAILPELSAKYPGVAARPLVEPDISREVALVTLRARAETPGMGALVREVTRMRWTHSETIADAPRLLPLVAR